jgi:hypothetical protein
MTPLSAVLAAGAVVADRQAQDAVALFDRDVRVFGGVGEP